MKLFLKPLQSLVLLLGISLNLFSQDKSGLITLEDIYKNYSFFPKSIDNLRSMNDGLFYTTLEQGNSITRWSYATGDKADVIFKPENSTIKKINDYEFSADEKKILISTAKERIYRRSYKAEFFVYDLLKKELIPLSEKGMQQLATFSPDGKKVAFVRDNNLFITDLENMSETRITTDGEVNKIINGATDWVYEEELGFAKGFAWSPDSKKLAFYRFDETGVKEFSLSMYKSLYPSEYKFKYPKAGEANSLVTIHTYLLTSGKTVKMDIGNETDQYIGRIIWTNNPEKLGILRLNRLQNALDVLHADASTGNSEVVFTEKNEKYINEPIIQ
jgi:dipeptidyl-peptidase-4